MAGNETAKRIEKVTRASTTPAQLDALGALRALVALNQRIYAELERQGKVLADMADELERHDKSLRFLRSINTAVTFWFIVTLLIFALACLAWLLGVSAFL